jgi:hypothetical protein
MQHGTHQDFFKFRDIENWAEFPQRKKKFMLDIQNFPPQM